VSEYGTTLKWPAIRKLSRNGLIGNYSPMKSIFDLCCSSRYAIKSTWCNPRCSTRSTHLPYFFHIYQFPILHFGLNGIP